ncbi:hypothetical protein NQ318_007730 [Aromia moschata]|uniref:Uncharacterized protein n=1 Tax=Aromia moschata TaxID=1265417 RepID=A0AAV8Z0N8_9CUCU|nr:hypothetical protein NQ318_007730 [Aromia moschata]
MFRVRLTRQLWISESKAIQKPDVPDLNGLKRADKLTTKRTILSCISQIFDPLGLLSPCVIIAKVIIQDLWLAKLGWDDLLPKNLSHVWSHFIDNLPILKELKIARRVRCVNPKIRIA